MGADDNITLTFNENVQRGSGAMTLTGNNNVMSLTGHHVTFDGATVTMKPPTTLQTLANYTLTIDGGAVLDVHTNYYNNYTIYARLICQGALTPCLTTPCHDLSC